MPVGLVPAPAIVQVPTSEPESVYLKTLSVVESLTTQRDVPSVTMSLGLTLPLLRLKLLAALRLPASRPAALAERNTLSWLASMVQPLAPSVAMPSTSAFPVRLPGDHDP